MWSQFIDPPLFMKLPHRLQPPSREDVEQPLNGSARHIGQLGDPLVRLALRLQPQNFHPPLHPGIDVIKPVMSDGLKLFVRELESAHPCTSQKQVTVLIRESPSSPSQESPMASRSFCAKFIHARYNKGTSRLKGLLEVQHSGPRHNQIDRSTRSGWMNVYRGLGTSACQIGA
jgi:hypothetical protein